MSETASAQPLTLFQSPVMAALERMLGVLERRVAGPQSQFGSRNLNFVDRLLSRRLDTLGLRSEETPQVTPRTVEPQRWLMPRSWVPSPTELTAAEQPASQEAVAIAQAGAAPRRQVVAPLPSRAQAAPPLPMPLPPTDVVPAKVAPTVAPQSTSAAIAPPKAAPAAALPSQPVASPLQPTSAVVPPQQAPFAVAPPSSPLPSLAPSAPSMPTVASESTVAPSSTVALPPQVTPVVVAAPQPTFDKSASELPQVAAVESLAAPPRRDEPPTSTAPVAASIDQPAAAPRDVSAPLPATSLPASPVDTAAAVAAPSSVPSAPATVADRISFAPAAAPSPAKPGVAAASPAPASPPAASPAIAAAPAERRVRDWLEQFSVARPSTIGPTAAAGFAPPIVAAAPRYSALARAFSHLGFADNQLVRSPAQRLAAAELSLPEDASAQKPSLSMPMVATPDLVAPSRQRQPSAGLVTPSSSPLLPTAAPIATAAAPRLPFVSGAEKPITTAAPTLDTATFNLPNVAMPSTAAPLSPAVASPALPSIASSIAATASPIVTAAAAAAESTVSRLAPTAPARPLPPSVGSPSVGSPLASRLFAPPTSGMDLGILGSPISPALTAAHVEPAAQPSPIAAASALPSAWSAPGALASHFDRFATAHGRVSTAAPAEGAAELREWAAAPGVPLALSRALNREASYTPARWQPVAATLPYLPMPAMPGVPTAATQPTLAGPSSMSAAIASPRSITSSSAIAAPATLPFVSPSGVSPSSPSLAAAMAPTSSIGGTPSPDFANRPLATTASGSAPPAAQPWREAGGAATLAELFAAGIGLGSGAVATLAQTFSTNRGGSLISTWLEPILRAPSPVAGEPSPLQRLDAPRIAEQPLLARLPQSIGRRETAAPFVSRIATDELTAAGEPSASPSPRFAQTAAGMVFVPGPSVERRTSSPMAPGASFSQPGAMGLFSERLATAQGPRVVVAGPQSAAEMLPWAQAPGISPTLARTLSRDSSSTPDRWQQMSAALPYLSAPQPTEATSTVASRLAPTAFGTTQPIVGSVPPEASRTALPLPLAAGAVSSPALETARPWQLPGGAAALAELFAAGVGLGSGAASLLAEPVGGRKGSLVADWLRPFLRPQEASESVSSQESRRLPTSSAPLAYVPWAGPDDAPREEARRHVEPARAGEVAPRAAFSASETRRPDGLRERPQLGPVGGLSAFAEQFAAVHGLGGAATPSAEGRFVPVVGGMVFVPRAEAPPRAEGEPAIATSRPQLAPPSAWSLTGGMSLRSELFATQQVARSAPPSLRELDRASDAMPDASQRWGFSGSGGLIYLGPNVLPQPSGRAAQAAGGALSGGTLSTPAGAAPESLRPGVAATARTMTPSRPSILDLALAGLLRTPGTSEGEASRDAGFPFAWLPPGQVQASGRGATREMSNVAPSVAGASPFVPASLRSEQVAERRSFAGGLPMLPAAASSASGAEQAATPAVMGQTTIAPRRAPVDVGSQYAAPMLTSFPRENSDAQAPRMLWPQSMNNVSERLSRLLSILPVNWEPPPSVLAAVSASGVAGMPFWQRMPAVTKKPEAERGAAPQLTPVQPSMPMLSTPGGRDEEKRGADVEDERPEETRMSARRPSMTVLSGDDPRPPRQKPPMPGAPRQAAAAAQPTSVGQPPEIAMLSAALKASGANSDQIEASMRLVEAMRSQGTSRPTKTDDRLNLGDLTMIALTMGERRMAASSTGAMGAYTRIGSVEKALHMHPSEHPRVKQEDTDLMKKVDSMAEQVMKHMDRLKNNENLRGGRNM